MDGSQLISPSVKRGSSDARDPFEAVRDLQQQLGRGPFAAVILFISSEYDTSTMRRALVDSWDSLLVGCSTAGELGAHGYATRHIVAIGLPSRLFVVAGELITDLTDPSSANVAEPILRAREAVARAQPRWNNQFAMMLSDGLSRAEDKLAAALSPALGSIPLFGGSAADGLGFVDTVVYWQGTFYHHSAAVLVVRTCCQIEVFSRNHFMPTDRRMVVTSADPEARVVHEINAEPAAEEYARLIGYQDRPLTPFVFATNPVAVRVGGENHVRSIQKAERNGDLRFFSAIDTGMVLSVAKSMDIQAHLSGVLARLSSAQVPDIIIACDCIFRRLELEETGQVPEMSALLARHQVLGFSTYGEQIGSVHVNQTFTGVAIYHPQVTAVE